MKDGARQLRRSVTMPKSTSPAPGLTLHCTKLLTQIINLFLKAGDDLSRVLHSFE